MSVQAKWRALGLGPGDRVEVRGIDPHYGFDWRPGTVTLTSASTATVKLDEPLVLRAPMGTFTEWLVSSPRSIRRLSPAAPTPRA